MEWIILSLFVGLIAFILLGFQKKGAWRFNKKQLLAFFALLLVIPSLFAAVPTGHTGIMTLFGEVQDGTLEAGLHAKNPFMKVIVMDNRAQKATVETVCYTSDIQEVKIIYTINYQIEKTNAHRHGLLRYGHGAAPHGVRQVGHCRL